MISGKILKFSAIDLYLFSNQLPTDPRNDLFTPGMKETREAYASGGGGSTQLGISFEQYSLGSQTPGLYRRHMSGRSTPYDQHINIEYRCIIINCGRILGTRLANKTGRCEDRRPSDLLFKKVSSIHKILVQGLLEDLNVICTKFLTKFLHA